MCSKSACADCRSSCAADCARIVRPIISTIVDFIFLLYTFDRSCQDCCCVCATSYTVMAAVPFGFSFGDFVAAIEVVHKAAQALRRYAGARNQIMQAAANLENFEASQGTRVERKRSMIWSNRQQLQLEETFCDRHVCLAVCDCAYLCRLFRMSDNEYCGSYYALRCPFRRSKRDRFCTGAPSTAAGTCMSANLHVVTTFAQVTFRSTLTLSQSLDCIS